MNKNILTEKYPELEEFINKNNLIKEFKKMAKEKILPREIQDDISEIYNPILELEESIVTVKEGASRAAERNKKEIEVRDAFLKYGEDFTRMVLENNQLLRREIGKVVKLMLEGNQKKSIDILSRARNEYLNEMRKKQGEIYEELFERIERFEYQDAVEDFRRKFEQGSDDFERHYKNYFINSNQEDNMMEEEQYKALLEEYKEFLKQDYQKHLEFFEHIKKVKNDHLRIIKKQKQLDKSDLERKHKRRIELLIQEYKQYTEASLQENRLYLKKFENFDRDDWSNLSQKHIEHVKHIPKKIGIQLQGVV